jgi:hypothetical protein
MGLAEVPQAEALARKIVIDDRWTFAQLCATVLRLFDGCDPQVLVAVPWHVFDGAPTCSAA